MALERENTEYIDFISTTFYPDVDVFLETVMNANTPRMYDDAKKIRDDVLQLEKMFKTKMRQKPNRIRVPAISLIRALSGPSSCFVLRLTYQPDRLWLQTLHAREMLTRY